MGVGRGAVSLDFRASSKAPNSPAEGLESALDASDAWELEEDGYAALDPNVPNTLLDVDDSWDGGLY